MGAACLPSSRGPGSRLPARRRPARLCCPSRGAGRSPLRAPPGAAALLLGGPARRSRGPPCPPASHLCKRAAQPAPPPAPLPACSRVRFWLHVAALNPIPMLWRWRRTRVARAGGPRAGRGDAQRGRDGAGEDGVRHVHGRGRAPPAAAPRGARPCPNPTPKPEARFRARAACGPPPAVRVPGGVSLRPRRGARRRPARARPRPGSGLPGTARRAARRTRGGRPFVKQSQ